MFPNISVVIILFLHRRYNCRRFRPPRRFSWFSTTLSLHLVRSLFLVLFTVGPPLDNFWKKIFLDVYNISENSTYLAVL